MKKDGHASGHDNCYHLTPTTIIRTGSSSHQWTLSFEPQTLEDEFQYYAAPEYVKAVFICLFWILAVSVVYHPVFPSYDYPTIPSTLSIASLASSPYTCPETNLAAKTNVNALEIVAYFRIIIALLLQAISAPDFVAMYRRRQFARKVADEMDAKENVWVKETNTKSLSNEDHKTPVRSAFQISKTSKMVDSVRAQHYSELSNSNTSVAVSVNSNVGSFKSVEDGKYLSGRATFVYMMDGKRMQFYKPPEPFFGTSQISKTNSKLSWSSLVSQKGLALVNLMTRHLFPVYRQSCWIQHQMEAFYLQLALRNLQKQRGMKSTYNSRSLLKCSAQTPLSSDGLQDILCLLYYLQVCFKITIAPVDISTCVLVSPPLFQNSRQNGNAYSLTQECVLAMGLSYITLSFIDIAVTLFILLWGSYLSIFVSGRVWKPHQVLVVGILYLSGRYLSTADGAACSH
jgi:hypothetical protein